PTSPDARFEESFLDYRMSRFDAVVERLRPRTLPSLPPSILKSWCQLVLAMAYQRLGKTAEATQELNAARVIADKAIGRPDREVPDGLSWPDWLRYQILRREAEELILYAGFPTDPFAWER